MLTASIAPLTRYTNEEQICVAVKEIGARAQYLASNLQARLT
jgi:hypothetical protein